MMTMMSMMLMLMIKVIIYQANVHFRCNYYNVINKLDMQACIDW